MGSILKAKISKMQFLFFKLMLKVVNFNLIKGSESSKFSRYAKLRYKLLAFIYASFSMNTIAESNIYLQKVANKYTANNTPTNII
jgi:hypothetical protein